MLYKALKKYVYGQEVPQGQVQAIRSLGQAIKEERTRCKMPQEFVAQPLGGEPAGGFKMGKRHRRPQHCQLAGAGPAVWGAGGGAAERDTLRVIR